MVAGVAVNLAGEAKVLARPPGSAHSIPTSVLGQEHPLWASVYIPPTGGIAWLGSGLSEAVGSGREGMQVCANGTQRLAWNTATSPATAEPSPGSRFTWHLVMVITAEL